MKPKLGIDNVPRAFRAGPVAYVIPALGLLGLFSLYPFVILLRLAVSDAGPTNILGPWEWVGLANLADVLGSPRFWNSFGVTGILTAVVFISSMAIGFMAACVLANMQRKSGALLALLVLVWALPPLVGGSVWKFLMARNGLLNELLGFAGIEPVGWLSSPELAIWSVSMVSSWATVPFAVLVYRGAVLSVDPGVLEAAELDGAGFWKARFRVVFPMVRNTTLILGTLVLIYAFRSFDIVYVMTSGGPGQSTQVLSILAYQDAFDTFELSQGAGISVIALVVMLVLIVPYARNVRREERAE